MQGSQWGRHQQIAAENRNFCLSMLPGNKEALNNCLWQLARNTHLCLLYESPEDQMSTVIPFLQSGLAHHERCLYVFDETRPETIHSALQEAGVNVESFIDSGQLAFASSDDVYLAGGRFEPGRMLDLIQRTSQEALEMGYQSLRITGEMTWALKGAPGTERLNEYEAKINLSITDSSWLALCQYNLNRFQPDILLDAIRTHPYVIQKELFCENPFYLPPESLLGQETQENQLNRLLGCLQRQNKERQNLVEYRRILQRLIVQTKAGYFFLDQDGRLRSANPALGKLFACHSQEELLGQHYCNLLAESGSNNAHHWFKLLMKGYPVSGVECTRLKKDGTLATQILSAHPVKRDEEIIGVEGFMIDNTREKKHQISTGHIEATLRLLVEKTDDLIIVYDKEGRYQYFNAPAKFGIKPGEVVGKKPSDFLPPEEAKQCLENVNQVFQSGETVTCENKISWKGETIWLLEKIFPLHGPDGRIETVAKISRDITSRKKAETSLKESERHHREIVEDQTEFICRFTPDGVLNYVNPSFARFWGRKPEDFIGLNFLDLLPEQDRESLKEYFAGFTSLIPVQSREHEVIGPLATRHWHHWIDRARFDESGEVEYFQSVGRDITDRRRAENALLESEERFRQLAENIREVFWVADPVNHKILYVSPAYESLWGHSCESACQSPSSWLEAIHPEDRPRVRSLVDRQMEGYSTRIEYRINRPDGSTRWVVDRAFPLRNEQGKVYRIVGIASDDTERRRAEEAMITASRMEATATLAGGIAHDFNNLMVGVLGNAELLRGDLAYNPEACDMLEDISQAAQRAGALAQQMLAYARGGKYQPEEIQLNKIIRETLRIHQHQLPQDIELILDLEPDLPKIFVDQAQMGQAILYLCLNAEEALEGRGNIEISTRKVEDTSGFRQAHPELPEGRFVEMNIRDTGCGIPNQLLKRIFEPFFTTKFQGRGLGLSATYGIIKNHGGKICVESQPGEGSTFKILLPACESQEPTEAASSEEPIPHGKETLLVVDDDPTVRRVCGKGLSSLGYTVLCAQNAREAIEIAQEHPGPIELALLDMKMPGMNGDEVFPHLRSLRPEMKILISSAYGEDEITRQLIEEGACDFLMKPFRLEFLAREIRSHLEKE